MKTIILYSLLIFSINSYCQLPYSKMLGFTPQELQEQKFKYDKKKNRYVLSYSDGLQTTVNVINALNGTVQEIRPSEDDYEVTVQYGIEGVSYVSALFYKESQYLKILDWLIENGVEYTENKANKLSIIKFTYGDYNIDLRSVVKEIKRNTGFLTKDESYNVYVYTIWTAIEPDSPWHRKEAAKEEKRKAKGKKSSDVGSFM